MKQLQLIFPTYVKITLTLLSVALVFTALYLGQNILIPLLLSLLFAIVLRPLVVFLTNKLKLPHVIAVLAAVVLFVIFIIAILLFISWQVSQITNDWRMIKQNVAIHSEHIQQWVKQNYHISYFKQQSYINRIADDTLNGETELMGNTLSSFTDTLLNAILIPIYTFLVLLYRNLFIKFLTKVVNQKNEQNLISILMHIKTVIQSYIVGLLIETGVVAVLTTTGLFLLGVEYAVLLGVITAILNLIPYIGILVACVITLFATLVNSTDISVMLGVIGLSMLVQFIDNNILVPKIVGNKVRINALVSMVGVILGGAIAGVAGMFLAIPLIAILKVIFDRIEPLAPWGFLMGDELPKTFDWYKFKLPDFSRGNSGDAWPEQMENIKIKNPSHADKRPE